MSEAKRVPPNAHEAAAGSSFSAPSADGAAPRRHDQVRSVNTPPNSGTNPSTEGSISGWSTTNRIRSLPPERRPSDPTPNIPYPTLRDLVAGMQTDPEPSGYTGEGENVGAFIKDRIKELEEKRDPSDAKPSIPSPDVRDLVAGIEDELGPSGYVGEGRNVQAFITERLKKLEEKRDPSDPQ